MKNKTLFLLLYLLLTGSLLTASAQGTAFTYQGRLVDGNGPATGLYDLRFRLLDAAVAGAPLGNSLAMAVPVTNGLFTVLLDFGSAPFNSSPRWLEIGVRTNGSVTPHTLMNPLTPLTAAPQAIYAQRAGSVSEGAIQANQLNAVGAPSAGQVLSYNGTSLAWQNPVSSGGAWAVGGNTAADGNFLGTRNNLPLELKANNARILRLEPNDASPNLIAGWNGNAVLSGASGGTISGGGAEFTFGRASANVVADDYGTVSGGANNIAGLENGDFHDGWFATVGGGQANRAEGIASTIGGGSENRASNNDTTVGGGYRNQAINLRATVGGGQANVASGEYSKIGGGVLNRAEGVASTIGGGAENHTANNNSTLGGGYQNQALNQLSTVSGGQGNVANGDYATVGGGARNIASGPYASVGGGSGNRALGYFATVPGGVGNQAVADFTFAAGDAARANHPGCFVWADSYLGPAPHPAEVPFSSIKNDEFAVRANGGARFQAPYLTVSGSGNEGGYIGGDGVGGEVHVGSLNPATTVVALYNQTSGQYMHLNLKSCTIFGGADLAEPFQMSETNIAKGAVVVIDPENPGHLRMSDTAYDSGVAGIVSGANGVNPGIALQQQGVLEGGQNVALSGRVYVQADASSSPIKPGDLLTTSSTPGHAMKVTDQARAQGAIIGKAMSALTAGKGMVLVLVSLQ